MKAINTSILILLSVISLLAQEERKFPRPLNEVEYTEIYKNEFDQYIYKTNSPLNLNDTININWQKLNGPYGGIIGGLRTKGDTIIASTGMDKDVIFYSTNGGLSWYKSNFKNEKGIFDFIFTDYGTVIAAGLENGLLESTDLINWYPLKIPNLHNPIIRLVSKDSKGNIYFTDQNQNYDMKIYMSNDSGKTWQLSFNPSEHVEIRDFLLDDNGDLYTGGYNKIFVKRKDSIQWVECSPGIYNNLGYNMTQDESGNIYAGSGNRSEFFESRDSGKTWIDKDTIDFLLQLYYHDLTYNNGTLITAGWPDYMLSGWGVAISKDKGSTWEYSNEGLLPYSYAGRLATSGEDTYLGMYGGGIYRSTNQGDDWHPWMTGLAGASSWQIIIDNKNNLYASTFGAGVQKSTDGGETWELLHNGLIDGRYYALLVDSSGKLYTGGDQGIFILNPGTTQWEKVYSGAMIALYGDGKGNVYGTDRYGGLVRSRDSGKTWENLNANNDQLFSFTIDLEGNLYIGEVSGSIRISTDNGLTWNTIKPSSGVYHVVNSVAVSKSGTIWAANDVQGLVKSTDDGITWEVVIPGRAWRVFINDKDEIFFSKQNRSTYPDGKEVFSDGGLFYSKDEGKTWSNITGNMQYIQVNDILFKDNGEILLSTDESMFKGSLPLSIEDKKDEQVITEYSLSQNYPNPFNPSTTITFALPEAGYVTLKVYNTLGEEVKTLVDEYKQTGNHQVSFNAKDLSSGLYIYKLNAGGKIFSKKMMLLK